MRISTRLPEAAEASPRAPLRSWRQAAEPDFAFGHKITRTIDAVQESIAERRWVRAEEV